MLTLSSKCDINNQMLEIETPLRVCKRMIEWRRHLISLSGLSRIEGGTVFFDALQNSADEIARKTRAGEKLTTQEKGVKLYLARRMDQIASGNDPLDK